MYCTPYFISGNVVFLTGTWFYRSDILKVPVYGTIKDVKAQKNNNLHLETAMNLVMKRVFDTVQFHWCMRNVQKLANPSYLPGVNIVGWESPRCQNCTCWITLSWCSLVLPEWRQTNRLKHTQQIRKYVCSCNYSQLLFLKTWSPKQHNYCSS
jgi:hypothetical protein